jgi:lipid A 4'-phosphatase
MATLRMMAGAHFPSEVIFAGVFTYLIIWIVYALIYRWSHHLDRVRPHLSLAARGAVRR